MVNEDDLATPSRSKSRKVKEVHPVLFFDRDKLPANQKDFRAKAEKVRPTVPPMDVEPVEPETPEAEPAAADPIVITAAMPPPVVEVIAGPVTISANTPAQRPTAPPPATHPSRLPAKD